MTKKLHLFLTMLLCAVFGMVQAQEVTLDFTTNDDWGFPVGSANKATDAASFTNADGYTVTAQAPDGYYFNTQGYLMLGKEGASLTLPKFDFKVSRIDVVGNGAASGSTVQNIFVGETAVSEQTVGAKGTNEYDIDEAHRAVGTIYTLKVLSAHNTQITKIIIYKEGTSAKSNPNLAFSSSSATATLGKDFTEPTLTNEGNGAVTYTSDNTDVATVNASTGEVTPVAVGTTKITATSAETATYYAGSASYTLKVVEPTTPGDYTFDFTGTNDYGTGLTPSSENTYITEDHTWTSGDVKLVTSGKYRWWAASGGNDLRFYTQKVDDVETTKMTISVPNGYTISKIEITGGQQFTSDDGLYASGKWEGSANSVTLTYASTSAVKVRTINVTYSQGGVDPQPGTTYNSIAEIKQLETGASGKLKFNNVQVLYANGKDLYAKDNTGAINFYFEKTDAFNYTAGQKLNGTATVTYDVYNEMPEIIKVEDASITATNGTATPVQIALSANLPDYICQLVKLTGKFKVEKDGTRTNYYLTDGTNSIQIYNKWHLTDFDLAQVVDGSQGTATGIVVTYKSGENIYYEIALTALEYQSAGLIDPQLAFSAEEVTATLGEDFTEPTLSAAQDFDFGNLKYSSSNKNVATVDEGTGEVTLVAAGTTTITAKSEAYDEFLAGSASYKLTVVKPEAQPGTDKFVLVSDASTLAAGDVIILVGTHTVDEADKYWSMSDQSGNWRSVEEVTLESDGSIIPNSYVQQITLEGAADAWYLNVGDGYLYATSSGSNYMGTADKETAGDNAKAKINTEEVVNEETQAKKLETTIVFQGGNTRNDLRFNYNNGNPRFTCYASTTPVAKELSIYRKVTSDILGDVNGDGKINMMDVTAVINYILGKSPSPFIYENACMNDDPFINMQDVTAIINIILGIK